MGQIRVPPTATDRRNRVVFVGDGRMVTLSNLAQLREAGQGYLVGLQRRNRKDIP